MNDSKALRFLALIYPYALYHLLILWNWFMWSRIPMEISLIVTIGIFVCVEILLSRALREEEKNKRKNFFISAFFLALPLIFVVILMYFPPFFWLRWAISFFYINHAVFLDYELLGMLLLTFISIFIGFILYLIFKRYRVILGLYLPWLIFISPLILKYMAGGTFKSDVKKYGYIEQVVDPVREKKESVLVPPAPRGIFIEDDKIFTVYESTIIPSFAEERLFVYRMDTDQLSALKLPGMGVRRIFSREGDPYIYILIWKMNPGVYRVDKRKVTREGMECLLSLESSYLVSKELGKLYQVGNMYLDRAGKIAYLIPDSYPAVGKFYPDTQVVSVVDLYTAGFCPAGSILGFMPSVDQEERYMYLSLTNCFCGVVKIDMQRLDVSGCYEIEDPRKGFYGVTFYKDGQIIAFPVVKYYKTVVLDAESMQLIKEYDKPPFNYIRDVLELDLDNLLCLGFFGDLAVFNLKTGKFKPLMRNLGFSMGLFKYGDYVYFNTAKHGILRVKFEELFRQSGLN